MSKYPVKRKAIVPRERDADVVEVIHPAPRGGFSFRYSFTEISAVGGAARVTAKRARYEDGKLSTESFEAEVDRGVYDRMIDDAQRLFVEQTALFQRMLAAFLPAPPRRERDRE